MSCKNLKPLICMAFGKTSLQEVASPLYKNGITILTHIEGCLKKRENVCLEKLRMELNMLEKLI